MSNFIPPRPGLFSEEAAQQRKKEAERKVAVSCIGWVIGFLVAGWLVQSIWNDVIVSPAQIGLHAGTISYGAGLMLYLLLRVIGGALRRA